MKFAIRVEEILARTVIVEAYDLEEAIEKAEDACNCDEICLGVDDFFERNVHPSEIFKGGIVPDGRDVSFYEHLKE